MTILEEIISDHYTKTLADLGEGEGSKRRTMITTTENRFFTLIRGLLVDDRISSMTTNIVESLYFTIFVLYQEEVETGDFKS